MSSTLALRRHDPLRPPPAPGLGRGIVLALIAHGLLVIGLTAGLNWRSQSEPAIEAELWAAVPVAAAPREEAPPPEPEPEPAKPTPEPPKPDLRAQQQEQQQQREAEIAAEREKKKKIEEKKRADEEADRKKREQELKDKKLREDKLKEEAKAKQEKQEKAQQEAQQKKKAEAALEKQRQDNLKRMMGMAGATGAPNATGTAQQSAGPSSSYGGRIKARVRPNIIYSDSGLGNPVAEAEVRAAPDGTILSYRLLKPSGDAEWDKAVLRAIEKTAVLPRDVDGRVPSVLVITFQPRE